jgi:hypothetical protein
MRNMVLVDAVITLHEIARVALEETGDLNLHDDIRNCAERLHIRSIQDSKINDATNDIIKKAKK